MHNYTCTCQLNSLGVVYSTRLLTSHQLNWSRYEENVVHRDDDTHPLLMRRHKMRGWKYWTAIIQGNLLFVCVHMYSHSRIAEVVHSSTFAWQIGTIQNCSMNRLIHVCISNTTCKIFRSCTCILAFGQASFFNNHLAHTHTHIIVWDRGTPGNTVPVLHPCSCWYSYLMVVTYQ